MEGKNEDIEMKEETQVKDSDAKDKNESRSPLLLKGTKLPLSLYTRLVIDVSDY